MIRKVIQPPPVEHVQNAIPNVPVYAIKLEFAASDVDASPFSCTSATSNSAHQVSSQLFMLRF